MPQPRTKEPTRNVGVRFSPPVIEHLRAEAARRDVTLSTLIRGLIAAQLRERARRSARKAAIKPTQKTA